MNDPHVTVTFVINRSEVSALIGYLQGDPQPYTPLGMGLHSLIVALKSSLVRFEDDEPAPAA